MVNLWQKIWFYCLHYYLCLLKKWIFLTSEALKIFWGPQKRPIFWILDLSVCIKKLSLEPTISKILSCIYFSGPPKDMSADQGVHIFQPMISHIWNFNWSAVQSLVERILKNQLLSCWLVHLLPTLRNANWSLV